MFIHLWSKDFQFPMLYILILYIGRLHCGVNCKCREFLGCNFDSKDCCSVLVLEYENFVFYYSNCPKHSCVSVVTAYAPASVVHPVLGYKLLPCFQIKTSSLHCCNESPALISSCCCSLGRGRGPLGEAGPGVTGQQQAGVMLPALPQLTLSPGPWQCGSQLLPWAVFMVSRDAGLCSP